MNKRKSTILIGTVGIILVAVFAFFGFGSLKGAADMRFGIDVRGGVEAVFEPVDAKEKPTESQLEAARGVMEARLDSKNILDREVTVDQANAHIIVRFPWKSDEVNFNPEKAISELGETAKLTFQDEAGNLLIDGTHVKSSKANRDEQGLPIVNLQFDEKGIGIFAKATRNLVGKNLSIYMDENLIFSGKVMSEIPNGQAVISGVASLEEAEELSDKINAGALPFSMTTTNHSTISPSMGKGALNVMIGAALLAFILVCIFMIATYRLTGMISCIVLIFQMACQLLCLSLPQFTLTLPGMAGLILSLGMAVDANIIISERISEELKLGKSIPMSIREGYKNAFAAVFDGNFTSGIVAAILMIFGSGTMLSFGYTLLTGVCLNLLAVLLSKQLLLSAIEFPFFRKVNFFKKKKDHKDIPFYKKRHLTYLLSAILILGGSMMLLWKGVSLDTGFAGGAMLKYSYEGTIHSERYSEIALQVVGRQANVQTTKDLATGQNKVILTLAGNEGLSPEEQSSLFDSLVKVNPDAKLELSESYIVEPYIGAKALKDSILAIGLAFLFIVLYVWLRFTTISGLSAGVMALIALAHDVLIVFFVFVVFGIPINDAFVAVTLTIIGYSINDTIVVYDRIRENRKKNKEMGLEKLVNKSITQTMSRSINTSLTTLICVVLILVLSSLYGINSIRVFALPMTFGLISGCYSSVCIAGALWVSWQKFRKKENDLGIEQG